jgi:CDP-glucose 4,6-dehydratase
VEGVAVSGWAGRSVLVTGGTGLLGGWLLEELLRRGASVTCLVRDWVPESRAVREGVLDRCRVVRGALEEYETALRAINEYEVDTIFHLGAQAIVGTAARSALSTFESNVRGTWTLLEAARQCSRLIQRVVVASSDKAYGAHERLPYTEDAPLLGRFPYDVSKACADLIAFSYWHTYRLPVTVTRCGNLFGGGDVNFNRLIPGTIRSLLLGERPVVRSDGTFVRDYFYVKDAVEAYLDLADRIPGDGVTGEAFNFGTETPLSVMQVVDTLRRVMGRDDLVPDVRNEATHEIPKQYLDCTKARTRLSWQPRWGGATETAGTVGAVGAGQRRGFEDALRETIDWYRRWLTPQQ